MVVALEAYATRPIRCSGVLEPERERLSKVGLSKDPGFPRYDGSVTVRLSSCATREDEVAGHDELHLPDRRRAAGEDRARLPVSPMRSYVVESYGAGSVVQDQRDRARLAAELGSGVRYVRTTFLPGDETLLHLFEATSPDALREAARDAALQYERIVEAVEGSTDSHEGEE